MKGHKKQFELSKAIIAKWSEFADEYRNVTGRYLDRPLSPPTWFLHEIPEADRALSQALQSVRNSYPDIPIHGQFVMRDGLPCIEVTWND